GITLRGAGPGRTTLAKTKGAKPFPQVAVGTNPSPLIIVGPSRYVSTRNGVVGSTNLIADAVKGAYAVTVGSAAGLGRGQVWASFDWRVVRRKPNPFVPYVDDFAADASPDAAGSWFSRRDEGSRAASAVRPLGN